MITRYYCSICNKSYSRKQDTKRHIQKTHNPPEFKKDLIYTTYDPKEIAEIPKPWNPPPKCRLKPGITPKFRTIPATKPYPYTPRKSDSTETLCLDELKPAFHHRTIAIYSIYGLCQQTEL